jgi:WD40 repeat protein
MQCQEVQTLSSPHGRVWCVAWNPTGTLFATGGADKGVRIWGHDGASWVCRDTLEGAHTRTVRAGNVDCCCCGEL